MNQRGNTAEGIRKISFSKVIDSDDFGVGCPQSFRLRRTNDAVDRQVSGRVHHKKTEQSPSDSVALLYEHRRDIRADVPRDASHRYWWN